MRVAVCDDNAPFRERVCTWLEGHPRVDMVTAFPDGESLCRATGGFDIIFLDIDMDGMNGIETARRLRQLDKSVKIVYVTSYADYVDGAFSVHAFSYLLKPVTRDVLFHQLEEALSYTPPRRAANVVEYQTDDGLERLSTDEIFYVEYAHRKIILHTSRGQFRFTGKLLEMVEKMERYHFASPHKSFLVNLYHVKAIRGYELTMMNGDMVPLSQKRSPAFRRTHCLYLAGQHEEET